MMLKFTFAFSLCCLPWICNAEQTLEQAISGLHDPALKKCIGATARNKQWTEVAQFTSLKCHSKKIISVAGLENFDALISISLHNNRISHFSASKWPSLKTLNLAKNKLMGFECQQMDHLENLYLFANRMTSLSLSSLPSLKKLKANRNQLVTFEYSSLEKLEKIYLFDNQLKTMDIDNLPSMKYLDARQNPMPDELYEDMDKVKTATILHDGNAEDWQ